MIALLTEHGTAMAETALCKSHTKPWDRREMRDRAEQAIDFEPGGYFVEVDNPELVCQICGATTEE